ncbi:unnamed protein product [Prorocentrum cordatum]|uniref:Altered inheritance of mitochondria protein 24, mitochondrial n=1 Tax=Prorocentrum cordatum TaxID=2364126 RepID=A0ABN9YAV1_9DINO|nr:unnamed protein product [Polarella glacialis]
MDGSFCLVPQTARERAWLGVGLGAGALAAWSFQRCSRPSGVAAVTVTPPRRVFKLAVASEVAKFRTEGRIESALDSKDGFVHLSDRTAPPKVASLFFKGAADLCLLELDTTKLAGPVSWFVGAMGDRPPAAAQRPAGGATAIHYLIADGCVHAYCGGGVSTNAIVREAPVPLGADGRHVFPDWL